MMASRDTGSHMYGLGSVCTFPNCHSLQTVPAPACKHRFGKELNELSNGSDYNINAWGYYRLPADSYAAINLGEPEVSLTMHAVISGPTSARTVWDICFSNFVENTTLHRCNSVWFWTLWRANSFKPPTTEHATTSVIHDEGTTDAAQRVPPSPGMDHDPSATLESSESTVLLLQELVYPCDSGWGAVSMTLGPTPLDVGNE